MKITDKQMESLLILNDYKSLEVGSQHLNGRTMNCLYFKGLVKSVRYANGEWYELTDKGLNTIDEYNRKNKK